MGANAIEFHQKRKVTIKCTVDLTKSGLSSLSGYTGTLTAKVNKSDTTAVITKTHDSIVGLVINFILTPTLTDVVYKIYHYDIIIDNGTDIYTVIPPDLLEIKKSVSN